MMRQALTEARPERRHEGMSPAIGGTVPLAAGFAAVRTHPLPGSPERRGPERRGSSPGAGARRGLRSASASRSGGRETGAAPCWPGSCYR